MNTDGSIVLTWGDGEHKFCLRIGQLRELYATLNQARLSIGDKSIGPNTLLKLLGDGDAWPHEIAEIIRLGLIGGGMAPIEASVLVKRYIDPPVRPAYESSFAAQMVLMAAFAGVPDDPVGKPQAEKTTMTGSSSPQSSEPERRSDGRRGKSTSAHSGNSQPPSMGTTEPMDLEKINLHQ